MITFSLRKMRMKVLSANFWPFCKGLTHCGRATHICVGDLTIIGSDNGLSPGRRQAIISTSAGILLIGPLGTNLSEILIQIVIFSFKKMRLKVWSAKWRPFCLSLNVLNVSIHLSFSGSPPSGRNQGNHGKCEKNLPDMEKSWNSISWEKSWKSHGNSNSGKENLFWFALQCLYYHIGRDLIKISLDPNMPCSLAEICAMTLYWL